MNKTVLVTGATGFVGIALAKRLLRENIRLRAAVRQGADARCLPAEAECVTMQSLSAASDYSEVLQKVDIVIHLAARVHIMRDTATDPLQQFRKVNLLGTERLARHAAQAGVKRFVFISTVKVHGEETTNPYREDSPLMPLEPYSISKAEAEIMLHHVAEETGLEMVIVRPPLVYGPGVRANFRMLLEGVGHGIPLPFASISNRRSFIFVENLVDALACCAIHPKAAGQAYLVSDGEDVSTPELVKQLGAAIGKPARLFPVPTGLMRIAGKVVGKGPAIERLVGSLAVDIRKIKDEIAWSPPYTLTQGLVETAGWFLKREGK